MPYMIARVLVIAGSDSGGGAGIQADIKTVTALGGYASSAVTALTAQNSLGIHGVFDVPPSFVRKQIRAVFDDIGTDAVKTGMLAREAVIDAVAEELRRRGDIPLVVDPVMVAKDGTRLLDKAANDALKRELAPLATVLTPNVPEAEELTGLEIRNLDDMRRAGAMLMTLGAKGVLITGGHLDLEKIPNVLTTNDGHLVFTIARVHSAHTHGTGCTLASAIATKLAQGQSLAAAVEQAVEYVSAAIHEAPGLGRGQGPIAHLNSYARRGLMN
jgi:hydroxymethylpyrimidine/phosphomethylpyrimidine kinase